MLSAWQFNKALAIIAASGVILTAGYILWTLQRVFLGAEYKGPHEEALIPMLGREKIVASVLLVFAIILGVFPNLVFQYMVPSIEKLTDGMAGRIAGGF